MVIKDKRREKFVIIPRTLVTSHDISYRDKTVYMALCLYANNETLHAHPSFETLAQVVGCQRRALILSINKLVECGFIEKIARYDPSGRQTSNDYALLDV